MTMRPYIYLKYIMKIIRMLLILIIHDQDLISYLIHSRPNQHILKVNIKHLLVFVAEFSILMTMLILLLLNRFPKTEKSTNLQVILIFIVLFSYYSSSIYYIRYLVISISSCKYFIHFSLVEMNLNYIQMKNPKYI